MRGERSYDDPCGIARALDLVGERWALLLVRELVFGPKRFTDVRRGLPGASQNVLAQRLRELRRDGIVEQIRLGPPAATRAYRLTERGRGLEPILLELARPVPSCPGRSGDPGRPRRRGLAGRCNHHQPAHPARSDLYRTPAGPGHRRQPDHDRRQPEGHRPADRLLPAAPATHRSRRQYAPSPE